MKKILQSWCIICEMDVGYTCKSTLLNQKDKSSGSESGSGVSSLSAFIKLWPLFCKYFKLKGEKYEAIYKFHSEQIQPFVSPFCGMCSREVNSLLKLHEELQSSMKKIQNSMNKIATTIRQSIQDRCDSEAEEYMESGSSSCSGFGTRTEMLHGNGEEGEIKRDDFILSQIEDLREYIIQGYKLQVVLSHGDKTSQKTEPFSCCVSNSKKGGKNENLCTIFEEEVISEEEIPAIEVIDLDQESESEFEEENRARSGNGSCSSTSSSKLAPQSTHAATKPQTTTTTTNQPSTVIKPTFPCDICSETFSTQNLLSTHRQHHNWSLIQQFNPKRIIPKIGSPGTFIVPGAGEMRQIQRGSKNTSGSTLAFQCCSCQVIEETIGSMIIHVRKFHPGIAPTSSASTASTLIAPKKRQLQPKSTQISPLKSTPAETQASTSQIEAQLCLPVKRARMTVNVQRELKGRGKGSSLPSSSSSSSFKAAPASRSYTSSPLSSCSSSSFSSSSINYSANDEGKSEEEQFQVQVITIPTSDSQSSESNAEIDHSALFLHGRCLYAQLEGDGTILKCIECGKLERCHEEIVQHIKSTHEK